MAVAAAAVAKDPTLVVEQEYFAAGAEIVIGVDEVGRGAIAGPVAVGVHAVVAGTDAFPEGLRDSKLLSEKRRDGVAPLVHAWGSGAVGFASAEEIDAHGITTMLGQAARRALLELRAAGVPVERSVILLDGAHDWLSTVLRAPLDVRTRVGADRACASVAAASVRAKVARDALMREADEAHPEYAWASNKGYGAKAHFAGIAAHGLTELHRHTWIKLSAVGSASLEA
ncbi:ribonuclease HII [Leucobacter chromiiresistens]|uniref:Ribonuclease n=1 Tax=Leucobacter chromiiresistens TaxID=1079994 RepID=A0A1H1A837_9MICO|nr:ribonuclease HII [Leucobacter chromiiresistens]SDQ35769.1 RNase HII [Leucobacter chromiiresistens]